MNKKIIYRSATILFLMVSAALGVAAMNVIDIESYLSEAKGCSNIITTDAVYLSQYIEILKVDDYVSHAIDGKQLSILFINSRVEPYFSINLYVDLSKPSDCKSLSVYEVLD